MDTEFDVVVFGATGFVGRLVAAELVATAPAGCRIALAGRDATRLRELARELAPTRGAEAPDGQEPVRPALGILGLAAEMCVWVWACHGR